MVSYDLINSASTESLTLLRNIGMILTSQLSLGATDGSYNGEAKVADG